MDSTSLIQLLGTSAGLKELQTGGERFGITLFTHKVKGVLDFGSVETENLHDTDAPRGYEAFSIPTTTLSTSFQVAYTALNKDAPLRFTLSSYTIEPTSLTDSPLHLISPPSSNVIPHLERILVLMNSNHSM